MINSRLNLLGDTERFSSLDSTILDLYLGKIDILKSGACYTYVKNKEKVERLKYKDYEDYSRVTYNKLDQRLIRGNVISNANYTVAINPAPESSEDTTPKYRLPKTGIE